MSSILETFFVLFSTNADEAEEGMASAERQAESLADAMADVGAVNTEGARNLDKALTEAGDAAGKLNAEMAEGTAAATRQKNVADEILGTALEIVEAERNLTQYLLGNEAIHKRTLELIGGEEGLQKRVAAETAAVARQLLKAEGSADRLEEHLSQADRTSRRLGQSFTGMARSILGPIAAVVSVGAIMGGLSGHLQTTLQLIERASRARIDVSNYDAWRRAIRAAGGDAERAEGQFEAFADKVTEAFGDAESEAGKALKAMGVSAADADGKIKSTDAALLDLADAMSKVSRQTAVDSLRRLGIVDPTMVDMILRGRDGLEQMLETQRKGGALTVAQAEAYKNFRTALNGVSDAWRAQVDRLMGVVLPAVTLVFDTIKTGLDWMAQNRTLVTGFGIALATALTVAAVVALTTYAPAMWAAAAATIAATWPIIAIIAAVTALGVAFALAYEDVKAFLAGQPSLLGELVSKYEWVRKAVDVVGKALQVLGRVGREAWAAISRAAEVVLPILARIILTIGGQLVRAFRFVAGVIQGVWSIAGPILTLLAEAVWTVAVIGSRVARTFAAAWSALFRSLMPVAGPAINAVAGLLRAFGNMFANIAGVIRAAWSAFFSWFADRLGKAVEAARALLRLARQPPDLPPGSPGGAVQTARSQINAANRSPTNSTTSTAIQARRPANRSTSVQIDRMEVNTQATDANGMARAAGGALQSELRRAAQDADDGVVM